MPELDEEGLLETERPADLRHVLRGRVRARDDRRRITRRQVDQHERHRGDDERHGNQREESPEDVGLHALTSRARR